MLNKEEHDEEYEKCPKCGSSVILEIDYGSKILRNQWVHTGSTLLSSVVVTRYVCADCGYSEEWIDKDDLPKLREKFPRVY